MLAVSTDFSVANTYNRGRSLNDSPLLYIATLRLRETGSFLSRNFKEFDFSSN